MVAAAVRAPIKSRHGNVPAASITSRRGRVNLLFVIGFANHFFFHSTTTISP